MGSDGFGGFDNQPGGDSRVKGNDQTADRKQLGQEAFNYQLADARQFGRPSTDRSPSSSTSIDSFDAAFTKAKQEGAFDHTQLKEALAAAEKEKVPVYEIIVSRENAGAKDLLAKLAELKAAINGKGKIVIIDADNDNTQSSEVARVSNAINVEDLYLRVVSAQKDQNGEPTENVILSGWAESLIKSIKSGKLGPQDINGAPVDAPPSPRLAKDGVSHAELLKDYQAAGKRIDDHLQIARSSDKGPTNRSVAEGHYLAAIAEADRFTMKDLLKERERIEKDLRDKTLPEDQVKVLNKENAYLDELLIAKASTRGKFAEQIKKWAKQCEEPMKLEFSKIACLWELSSGQRDQNIYADIEKDGGKAWKEKGFEDADLQFIKEHRSEWRVIADDSPVQRKVVETTRAPEVVPGKSADVLPIINQATNKERYRLAERYLNRDKDLAMAGGTPLIIEFIPHNSFANILDLKHLRLNEAERKRLEEHERRARRAALDYAQEHYGPEEGRPNGHRARIVRVPLNDPGTDQRAANELATRLGVDRSRLTFVVAMVHNDGGVLLLDENSPRLQLEPGRINNPVIDLISDIIPHSPHGRGGGKPRPNPIINDNRNNAKLAAERARIERELTEHQRRIRDKIETFLRDTVPPADIEMYRRSRGLSQSSMNDSAKHKNMSSVLNLDSVSLYASAFDESDRLTA